MIKFLLKGILRDRSRSLLPIIIVTMGAFLAVIMYTFMEGGIGGMIETSARFNTGHVRIMTNAYYKIQDQVPNDLALIEVSPLLEKLQTTYPDFRWMTRIQFGGLLDVPDENGETLKQGPVVGTAIDFSSNVGSEIMKIKQGLVSGALPTKPFEILISEQFANKLGLKIGDSVTLLTSTINGSMAFANFIVSGFLSFGINAMDRGTIIADIKDIQSVLDMPDGASDVLGFASNMIYDDKKMVETAKKFNVTFGNAEDEFAPIMLSLGEQDGLDEMLGYADAAGSIIVGLFVFAMAIVLWNSGLMGNLRRYGEIGIRLAMGEPKGFIYRAMILESCMIGIIGSIIGTIIGLFCAYLLEIYGLDYGALMQSSTMMMENVMRAKVTPFAFVIGFLPGVFAPALGAIFAGIGIYKRQTASLFKELEV